MHKPRKTTELTASDGQDSTRKQPTRQSRIARRTELPSERKVSTDRKTIAGPYRGNNFVTPIKTPAKGGFVPATNEKRPALDKKWAIEESARITEYLRLVQADIGKDFYSRPDGIRSMSTKDLVSILNFFLSSVGHRLEIKSAKDYVEETIKSMEKLKYPYNLTKSSLKTPTAPHSFTNIVQLLSWLKSLHMPQTDQGTEDDLLVFRENLYPNLETQKFIQCVSTESFKIWNSNQGEEEDQFVDIEEKAVDKIIYEKTGIHNSSEVLQRTEQTRKKCESLQKDIDQLKIPEDLKEKLAALTAEFDNYQSEINILEMNKKNKESENAELQNDIDRLKIHDQEVRESLDKLKNAINGQKATVQERDAQINKILYLEAKVNAVKNSIKEIQKTSSNDVVTETRLVSKIPIMIGKLKDFMSRVQDMTKSNIFESIVIEDNKDFKSLLETVKQIESIFKDAELDWQKKENILKQKIAGVSDEIDALDKELAVKNCELKVLNDKIADLEENSSKLSEEEVKFQEFCTTKANKTSIELESRDIDIKNKKILLADLQNMVLKSRELNRMKMCALEENAYHYQQLIDDQLDEMENYADSIQKIISEHRNII
ncbi:NDC80 family protein [Megaselia abdita]